MSSEALHHSLLTSSLRGNFIISVRAVIWNHKKKDYKEGGLKWNWTGSSNSSVCSYSPWTPRGAPPQVGPVIWAQKHQGVKKKEKSLTDISLNAAEDLLHLLHQAGQIISSDPDRLPPCSTFHNTSWLLFYVFSHTHLLPLHRTTSTPSSYSVVERERHLCVRAKRKWLLCVMFADKEHDDSEPLNIPHTYELKCVMQTLTHALINASHFSALPLLHKCQHMQNMFVDLINPWLIF